jgi:hypothetical protein
MSRRDPGPGAIFAVPLVVGGLSLAGLVGALLGDGVMDGIGAALLASGPAVAAWALAARRRQGPAAGPAASRRNPPPASAGR